MWLLVLVLINIEDPQVSALKVADFKYEEFCYEALVTVSNESPNPSAVFLCVEAPSINTTLTE